MNLLKFFIFGFFLILGTTTNATTKSSKESISTQKKSRTLISTIKKKESLTLSKKKPKLKRTLQGLADSSSTLSKKTLSVADKYQEDILSICQKQADANSKLLSFVEIIGQLRHFIKKQTKNLKLPPEDRLFWDRIEESLINKQALPDAQVLKEKVDASEKAALLADIFETHYRNYYQIPENLEISRPWPQVILQALSCIHGQTGESNEV